MFKNLFDLCKRTDTRRINRRVLEALIFAGALDKIGPSRASQISSIEMALKTANQHERLRLTRQVDLFSELQLEEEVEPDYVMAAAWSPAERLKHEKEVLGFYLHGHPIERFTSELDRFIRAKISELVPEIGKTVLIAGFVRAIKIVNTKSGNRLAIITLEDNLASIDVTMFAENFTAARACLIEEQLVIVEGEVVADAFSNGYRIRATRAMSLDQARAIYAKGLLLEIASCQTSAVSLHVLYNILEQYRGGNCPVFIAYVGSQAKAKLVLGEEWKVTPKEELLVTLQEQIQDIVPRFIY